MSLISNLTERRPLLRVHKTVPDIIGACTNLLPPKVICATFGWAVLVHRLNRFYWDSVNPSLISSPGIGPLGNEKETVENTAAISIARKYNLVS